MDKYKTSQLGQALKKVFHGTITVEDSVHLAEAEISEVFSNTPEKKPAPEVDHGKLGEIMGICPKCGKNVICGKSAYGCMGYADGCDFRAPFVLCGRGIAAKEMRELLAQKKTRKLFGFISRAGRSFGASLVLMDGKVEFDFHKKEEPEKPKKARTKKADGTTAEKATKTAKTKKTTTDK